MKILVTPTSFMSEDNAAARLLLEDFADEVVYLGNKKPLAEEEVIAQLQDIDGYIAGLDWIGAAAIKAAPASLRVISRYGAGVDRVDLAAATERGITVTNTPGTNATAVAELAFGLILACVRDIAGLHRQVEQGAWPRSKGVELCGKTLSILGLGSIGRKVARYGQAFNMRVVAHDPRIDMAYCAGEGIQPLSKAEAIIQADILTLHMPLNSETRHIVDSVAISTMKPGAVIINTARGGLVDEDAAAAALREGKLGGIGMDAFEEEPLLSSPLKGLERVVFTPHIGAHTAEAVSATGLMAVKNLVAILSGKGMAHKVN